MNKAKKILTTALALTAAASVSFTAFAATEHFNDASTTKNASQWTEWKAKWETLQKDYEQVSLTPGINETQLNFAWYSKTKETPAVKLSKKADMKDAVEFKGNQEAISFSKNALVGNEISDTDTYYSNKVTVKDLTENTEYYYQVFKNGVWSEPSKYSTKSFSAYSVLYVGDPQIGASKGQTDSEGTALTAGYLNTGKYFAARNDAFNWNQTLNSALSAHPGVSFMLSAGDQVNYADYENEYAGYLSPAALDSLPVSTTIGNHDSGSYQYSYHFNNPNSFSLTDTTYALGHTAAGTDYYYTYGDVLYVVIDTNNYNCATHAAVIEKAIQENPGAKWRVVMFHQDIYGSGLDHSDSDGMVLRTQLTPIFDRNKIDIVLQGHDHTYSRTFQLSGDGNAHASYDKNNYTDPTTKVPTEAFLKENNCYTVLSGASDGNKVIDPKGVVYMEANSSTGSKFYELIANKQDYIAERSQTWTPSYSVISFSETSATITTYDASTNKVLEGSAPYTIVKKSDASSLEKAVANAQAADTASYTQDSVLKLQNALTAANKVLANPESLSTQIASAEADIVNALAALTKNPPAASTDGNTPSNAPATGVTDALPTAALAALISLAGLVVLLGGEFKKKFAEK